jgi:hypothetical protein
VEPSLEQDPPQPVAPDQPGREAQDDGQDAHRGQRPQGHELVVGPQEQGDGHDREQLPHRPGGQQVAAEAATEHVVVAQDRQQRTQGGGGQPEGHGDEGVHEPGRGQDPDQRGGQGRGHQPAGDGQPPRPLLEQVEVELVAGEQEQEAEADVGQQVDLGPVGPAEDLGADHHPAGHQDDHLGDARPGQQGHQHRGERGHDGRVQQRVQAPGKIHGRPPALDLVVEHGMADTGRAAGRCRSGDVTDGRSARGRRPGPAQARAPLQPRRLGPGPPPAARRRCGCWRSSSATGCPSCSRSGPPARGRRRSRSCAAPPG